MLDFHNLIAFLISLLIDHRVATTLFCILVVFIWSFNPDLTKDFYHFAENSLQAGMTIMILKLSFDLFNFCLYNTLTPTYIDYGQNKLFFIAIDLIIDFVLLAAMYKSLHCKNQNCGSVYNKYKILSMTIIYYFCFVNSGFWILYRAGAINSCPVVNPKFYVFFFIYFITATLIFNVITFYNRLSKNSALFSSHIG